MIYPPIETQRFAKKQNKTENQFGDYYIIISALTEFKKIDIAIKSFNLLEEKLFII
ncbi:MAG: hypothetical protein P1U46_00165 [Patescibacteria group bacterium]|nr:hypothetical protein [Patescibacteria group bacterium]